MYKPFNNTGMMIRLLLKRDWLKYILWIIVLIVYAASGVGKLELAVTDSTRVSMYTLFNGPALVSLFGPTSVTNPNDFTGATAFGGLMPLVTVLVFAIVSIIYVANRTRKDEDQGIAEHLQSFRIGKLSNTAAVVISLFLLQVVMTLILAASIQLQNVPGMDVFSNNLLFAASITGQSFMWGMIALFFAQIFSESGSSIRASIGLFFILYIIRMGTDIKNIKLSWLNPLSWSYLTEVYVNNNWLPIVYILITAILALVLAFRLELSRDIGSGYLPETRGKSHAALSLRNITGLVFRLQWTSSIFWFIGIFVLGITYGSMISKIGMLVGNGSDANNLLQRELAISVGANHTLMAQQFLSTVYTMFAVLSTCLGITSMMRMVSEERKNRQEALYSLPNSRFKMFSNYISAAWVFSIVGQFAGTIGVYITQMGGKNALSFGDILSGGMPWIFGVFFVLSLLSLLLAFLPGLTSLIWLYVGFTFFVGVLGNLLDLPKWVLNLNIFHLLMRSPSYTVSPNTPNWSNLIIILVISIILTIVSYIGYRKRDLISG